MAMIAYKCPEIQVVVVDINQARTTIAASAGGLLMSCLPVLTGSCFAKQPCLRCSMLACEPSPLYKHVLDVATVRVCKALSARGATWSAVQQGAMYDTRGWQ